jgi:hypothetical protein
MILLEKMDILEVVAATAFALMIYYALLNKATKAAVAGVFFTIAVFEMVRELIMILTANG